MRRTATLLAALTAFTVPAHAGGFSDSFDTENGGSSALNYSGFAHFTSAGQADLVKSGDYGITCDGSCVDLDGTPGPGGLVSNLFNYNAGDLIKVSFDLGGSQRVSGGVDDFSFEMTTTSDGNFADTFNVVSEAGFANYLYSFTATAAGSLQFALSTTSADYIGPLVDNVSLDIAAVPEPSTWTMMIGGFMLVGASMRRRSTNIQFA